jgi:site-specific recombinase XerC
MKLHKVFTDKASGKDFKRRSIGLDPAAYGTHLMRRTKPTLIYRRTRNLRAVHLLFGHSKLKSTVRYLGIEGRRRAGDCRAN